MMSMRPDPQLERPPHTLYRWLIPLALAMALLPACTSEAPPARGARVRPGAAEGWNVVLLSLDTVRADRLGAYGHTRPNVSPRIDELVSQGARFDRAMAPRALTWPSLASVLTGLYPTGHAVTQNGYNLPDDLATLPLILREAGFQTGAFLSNMCKSNHQGWDRFFCAGSSDGRSVPEVNAWLEELEVERPFLLWIHLFAAHPPYFNGGDLAATVLDPGYNGPVVPRKQRLDRIMQDDIPLDEADLRHLLAVYDASIMGTDRSIGRYIDILEQHGKLDKTIIVLLADHGEDLYQHNRYLYHGCSVYQSSLHVPLAIVAPGIIPAGTEIGPAVELIDVLPTLLDLLNIEGPAESHGRSLIPLLQRGASPSASKPAFSQYGDTAIRTVLDYPWTLIDNPEGITPYCFADVEDLYPISSVELYNLAEDPLESINLAEQMPGKVFELQDLLRARFADQIDRSEDQELSEELIRELEALGYVAR